MSNPAPEWLALRNGAVKESSTGEAWFVWLDGQPQYRLAPIPAGGKFACHVVQTNNAKRLDKGAIFPTQADALKGGLDDLRKALGW